jgi:uncharacterized membrane protein
MYRPNVQKMAWPLLPLLCGALVILSTAIYHLGGFLPKDFSWSESLAMDLLAIGLTIPLLIHCLANLGKTKGLLFFFTVCFFMGGLESLWVFLGRLDILGDAYDYNRGILRFLDAPLFVALGWFMWIYVYQTLIQGVFPKMRPLAKALVCGVLCLCTDLWMDPATINQSLVSNSAAIWVWDATSGPVLFTVPLYNFIGWFISGAAISYAYQKAWVPEPGKTLGLRRGLLILAAIWLGFVVLVKALQLGIDALIPGANILPPGFQSGGRLAWYSIPLMAYIPLSMTAFFIIHGKRSAAERKGSKDMLLLASYGVMLLFNLSMVFKLQIHFPNSTIAFLLLSMLPIMAMIYLYLRKKPS